MIENEELTYYMDFLKTGLRSKDREYKITSIRSLQSMLKVDQYRLEFVRVDGIGCIVSLLNENASFQLQYQLIFCLWCLSFNSLIAVQIHNAGIVLRLCDILSECSKQKVVRIILATFRNLLEKIDDQTIIRESALMMYHCKMPLLELGNDEKLEDPDLQDDVKFLNRKLRYYLRNVSSFDEYCAEISSGRLQWSVVHKSENFWVENVHRFNERDYRLIKILIGILGMSGDPLILSVAAHDLGEYVRFCPSGKEVVQQLHGKDALMEMLQKQDSSVRYHALLAIQKLMVQNWEHLGGSLDAKKGFKKSVTTLM